MQFHDNLEIPGGNTRWQIKIEIGLGYCSIEDKCLNLHEKWYLKENMARTTIAKGQIPDIRWTYTNGIINLREALMIRSTSCPWAWTQSSRSTPTSLMHNLSFTFSLQRNCRVENYLVKHQKGMTYETLEVHTIFGKVYHWGILETYTTNFKSNYHQLKSRAWFGQIRE